MGYGRKLRLQQNAYPVRHQTNLATTFGPILPTSRIRSKTWSGLMRWPDITITAFGGQYRVRVRPHDVPPMSADERGHAERIMNALKTGLEWGLSEVHELARALDSAVEPMSGFAAPSPTRRSASARFARHWRGVWRKRSRAASSRSSRSSKRR